MRLAYVLVWRGGPETGPFKKVAAQARCWSELGAEVGLFVATTPPAAAAWRDLPETVEVAVPGATVVSRASERAALVDAALRWRPDVVYLRHGPYFPALARLARQVPVVLEVNGDDLRDLRAASRAKHAYNLVTRSVQLRLAAGVVFVTGELSRLPHYARYGRPSAVVTNGLDHVTIPPLDATAAGPPRLVMMGHAESLANGVDQVLRLAAARPDWQFELIGIPVPGPRPENVTAHPTLPPEAYRPILARADVGLGDLALWRLGLEEASALRVREYLASGLAAVIGYGDPDLPGHLPHVLQVPNRDGGIIDALPDLDRFVASWQRRRVPPQAVAGLDVRVKEQERLRFLDAAVRRGARG